MAITKIEFVNVDGSASGSGTVLIMKNVPTTGVPLTVLTSHKKKAEMYNGANFKRWQQNAILLDYFELNKFSDGSYSQGT